MKIIFAFLLLAIPASPALAGVLRVPRFKARVSPVANALTNAGSAIEMSSMLPAPLLDNGMRSRSQVLRALGYNPLKQPRRMLSDKGEFSQTMRIFPKDRPARVVKRANAREVQNELFVRAVIREFPIFSGVLHAPDAVGYKSGWVRERHVVVMENVAAEPSAYHWPLLNLRTRAALAVLVHAFGISDINSNNLLFDDAGGMHLVDFERARAATAGQGSFSETPWVSDHYINRYEDYAPTVSQWQKEFSKPGLQGMLLDIMRRAGIPIEEAQEDLFVFAANTRDLDKRVRHDIARSNEAFLSRGAQEGLSAGQTAALSRLNRGGVIDDHGGADIRLVRDAISLSDDPVAVFTLSPFEARVSPSEWAAFLKAYPAGLSSADFLKRVEAKKGVWYRSWVEAPQGLDAAIRRVAAHLTARD